MKAKELAEKLMKNPDFEINFVFGENDGSEYGFTVRKFRDIEISDISYSEKSLQLSGEEY